MGKAKTLSDEELLELLTLTVKVDEDGNQCWYNSDGQLHRIYGPAVANFVDGTFEYRINGQLHREEGPAIRYFDGTVVWFHNGVPHRAGGLACIYPDGSGQYWVNGSYTGNYENKP